jgi:hypothetical protein
MARKARSRPKLDEDRFKKPGRIISRLRRGKITPAEAETELKCRELPSLIQIPDAHKFDPRSKNFWTPLQAVAWIAFNDMEVVRRVSKDYRAKKTTLIEIGPRGAKPPRLDKAEVAAPRTTSTLDLHVARRGLPGDIIELAEQKLRSALQGKQIVATGIQNGKCENIDAYLWEHLRFFVDREDPEKVVYQRIRFEEVRLPSQLVMEIWQPPKATVLDEIQCIEELTKMMKEFPDSPETKEEVRKRFPNMTDRSFESAWKEAVRRSGSHKWSARGRRPNNRRTLIAAKK